jgi:metal-responsive CopG/Arc/MetJ family transcriptional regulator
MEPTNQKRTKVMTGIKLEADLIERVEIIAHRDYMSKSAVIRQAVRAFLQSQGV